jgi:hypothetical protein
VREKPSILLGKYGGCTDLPDEEGTETAEDTDQPPPHGSCTDLPDEEGTET